MNGMNGMRWPGLTAVVLAGLSLLELGCGEAVSGGCYDVDQGEQDGQVYNLRVYNCSSVDLYINVNGRNVGVVDAYDFDREVCGVTELGSFPQCSTGYISAENPAFSSTTIEWTVDALRENPNGCWIDAYWVYIDDPHYEDIEINLPDVEPPITQDQRCQLLELEGFE